MKYFSPIQAGGPSAIQCSVIDFASSDRLSTALLGEGTIFKEHFEDCSTFLRGFYSLETRFSIFFLNSKCHMMTGGCTGNYMNGVKMIFTT